MKPFRNKTQPEIGSFVKTEEIPYDFVRKRLSIAVQDKTRNSQTYTLITKGALDKVLEASTQIQEDGKAVPLDEKRQEALQAKFADWSEQGFRVLGVATKEVAPQVGVPG